MIESFIGLTIVLIYLGWRRRLALDVWATHQLAVQQRERLIRRRSKIKTTLVSGSESSSNSAALDAAVGQDLSCVEDRIQAIDEVIELSAQHYARIHQRFISSLLLLPPLES